MENNLVNKVKSVGGLYTLGIGDPNKLYFSSDT